MCSLCYCGDPSDSHVMTLDNFPTGVSILSYIYEEALFGIGSPNHLLLLYLLRKCCLPYLQFVQVNLNGKRSQKIKEEIFLGTMA